MTAQAIAGFLTVLTLLTFLGAVNVVEGRAHRLAARQPVFASCDDGSMISEHRLVTSGGELRLVVVADAAHAAPPPGLAQLPRPGEMYLSPAVNNLTSDPFVRRLLHYRPVGVVGNAGLIGPTEALAYVGVKASDFDKPVCRTRGFGGPASVTFENESVRQTGLALGIALFLIGFASVLRNAVRTSETLNRRRLGALAALGLSDRQLKLVMTVRGVLFAGLGAAIGGAVFKIVSTAQHVPMTKIWFFDGDTLKWSTIVIVVALAPLSAAMLALGPTLAAPPGCGTSAISCSPSG